MKEIVKSNSGQEWPTWKKIAILVQLGAATIGTLTLPIAFLTWAQAALAGGDREWADRWEELSYGVVALGPTLFVTSFLAMASQFLPFQRWVIRVSAFVLSGGILWGLYAVGPKIHISLLLSLVGVVYSLAADVFTPDGSDKPKSDDDLRDDDESEEPVTTTEAAEVSVDSASLESRV